MFQTRGYIHDYGTEVRLKFDVWWLISNINQIQFWLTFDIKHQPDRVLVDVWYQTSTRYSFGWGLTKNDFSYKQKWQSPVKKSVKIVYVFWNLQTLKRKENTYLEYMNINHEPVATWLMIDIKYHPDRVQVDIWYQTSTRCSSGWRLISNINQIEFWLTFDIKHQPGTVLVDVWRSMIFHTSKNDKVQSKKVSKLYTFFGIYIPWNAKKTHT